MAALKQFIAGFFAFQSPVWPHQWLKFARGLVSNIGWMPTMFLWSIFGLVVSVNFGMGRQQNIQWLERFNFWTWITWSIVAVLAIFMTSVRSARTLGRFGLLGPTRPRWWFEIASVAWSVTTISFIGIMLGLFLNSQQRQAFSDVFTPLMAVLLVSLPAFFTAATIGYAVSFVGGRRRAGKAYDCVHYFYSIVGSVAVTAYAASLVPPRPDLRSIGLPTVIGTIGVLWLGFAFISIICRYEGWERKQNTA